MGEKKSGFAKRQFHTKISRKQKSILLDRSSKIIPALERVKKSTNLASDLLSKAKNKRSKAFDAKNLEQSVLGTASSGSEKRRLASALNSFNAEGKQKQVQNLLNLSNERIKAAAEGEVFSNLQLLTSIAPKPIQNLGFTLGARDTLSAGKDTFLDKYAKPFIKAGKSVKKFFKKLF